MDNDFTASQSAESDLRGSYFIYRGDLCEKELESMVEEAALAEVLL